MEKINSYTKEDNNIINIDDIVQVLSNLVSISKELFLIISDTDNVEVLKEVIEEQGEKLSNVVKLFRVLKKVKSLPDEIFIKKIEKYCTGIVDIPDDKRREYIEKIGKINLDKDSAFTLNILNKTEEEAKIEIYNELFAAKVNQTIKDDVYRRLMIMTSQTMYSDLVYLKNNVETNEYIYLENYAEQGLFINGWILNCGIYGGSASESGKVLYCYNSIARLFCDIINCIK